MNTQKNIFWSSAMTNGLVVGGALLLLNLILWFTGNLFMKGAAYIAYLIIFGGIIWATLRYRKNQDGEFLPYPKALGYGTAVSLFAAVIMAVWIYVLYVFLDPGLIDEYFQFMEAELLNSGLSDDMIEQQLELSRNFISPGFMAFGQLFNTLFFGFLLSLIAAIVTKRKNPNTFDQTMSEIE